MHFFRRLMLISGLIVVNCMLLHAADTSRISRIYVSVKGNDLNNGTPAHPFASLEAAKMAVRKLKNTHGKLQQPVEIIIGAGTYFLSQTLELTPEDAGTKETPITWKAAPHAKVIISAGQPLKGKWQREGNGIWSMDIPSASGWKRNIDQPEHYTAKPSGPWYFRQLFINNKTAVRARFPNAGEKNPFLYAVDGTTAYVQIKPGMVKAAWANAPDAQINMVPKWRFYNQWNDIAGVDLQQSKIFIGSRERFEQPMNEGAWFWVEGVKEELDAPNEWYLDPVAGKLYYYPEKGQDPNSSSFIAPFLNRAVYLKGDVEKGTHVQYVHFSGLTFRHTSFTLGQIEARVHTDGAVVFENAQHCSVTDCGFDNIGGYAFWLHLDSRNNVFDHNTVQYSGGGGVLLTGARLSYMDDTKLYTPGEKAAKVFPILNKITCNTVEHCGRIRYYGGGVHMDSRPASMAMEPGNYIAHNHFWDLSRNGIFVFRNQGGNVVEFNEIHDCMQTTIDGAAIHFATMNRLSAPNYIMNNYLYDIWGYEQLPSGIPKRTLANGIFLDWATSNTTVKNNVIYNAGDKEIKPIMGNWNLNIDNNISAATRIAPFMPAEIGPRGKAVNCIYPEQLINTGTVVTAADTGFYRLSGVWTPKQITGVRNLFSYTCYQAAPAAAAKAVYEVPVTESGKYKVCVLYMPDAKNASNATITIQHADGTDKLLWNFQKGDRLGFALRVGEYYFDKAKPAQITISNENADGCIIADGVGLIKQN
jgi:hypothetical protein